MRAAKRIILGLCFLFISGVSLANPGWIGPEKVTYFHYYPGNLHFSIKGTPNFCGSANNQIMIRQTDVSVTDFNRLYSIVYGSFASGTKLGANVSCAGNIAYTKDIHVYNQ